MSGVVPSVQNNGRDRKVGLERMGHLQSAMKRLQCRDMCPCPVQPAEGNPDSFA